MKELRPYQIRSVNLILEMKRILLCLDMGLGKTASCLEAVKILKSQGKVKKTLIVAPKYVASKTWPDEINDEDWDFKSLTYSVIVGNPKQRVKAVEKEADIYIINKENLVWLYENNKLFCDSFNFMIFDESSALKSAKNKTTTGRMSRYKAANLIASGCEYVALLTGTPAPNGIEDLYGQVEVVKPSLLAKSKFAFMNQYFMNVSRTSQFPIWQIKKGAREEILDKVKEIMFKLKSEDVLELPEALYTIKDIEETNIAKEAVSEIRSNSYWQDEKTGMEVICETATVRYGKIKQISAGCVYYPISLNKNEYINISDNKMEALKEIIEESTSSVLVFYQYGFEKEKIKKMFGDKNFVNNINLEKFKNREIDYLFSQPSQIGHGLNIQAGGNTIVWLSLTDDLELYQQSNKRLHRSGQRESVVNIVHLLSGKQDYDLYDLLNDKDASQEKIINYMESV